MGGDSKKMSQNFSISYTKTGNFEAKSKKHHNISRIFAFFLRKGINLLYLTCTRDSQIDILKALQKKRCVSAFVIVFRAPVTIADIKFKAFE